MSTITWPDFEKIDLRVGTIIDVEFFEEAIKPAYKLKIDFGELGIKKSSAQITSRYEADALLHKQVIAVVNFPPKQIGKFMSECLVLGAVDAENNVTVISPSLPCENGLKIS